MGPGNSNLHIGTLQRSLNLISRVPLLLLIGNKDQEMSVSSCKIIINQAKKAHQQADIIIYPNAGHAFDTDLKGYTNPAVPGCIQPIKDFYGKISINLKINKPHLGQL